MKEQSQTVETTIINREDCVILAIKAMPDVIVIDFHRQTAAGRTGTVQLCAKASTLHQSAACCVSDAVRDVLRVLEYWILLHEIGTL